MKPEDLEAITSDQVTYSLTHDKNQKRTICPVCVIAWAYPGMTTEVNAETSEVAICRLCNEALDKRARGPSTKYDWLDYYQYRRKTLRENQHNLPTTHIWHVLHDIGQDYDQMIEQAISHEEANHDP